ncbi:penicillin acylase family protein [Microbispora sp. KK1-11]|uniref:penicillin acylase family protein n=1 Tax=Microbispora sp. KK1-11 TaxID=2053005 RepID=UPI00115A9A7F|nr:penicillin acylase family protein [Microbispora sp. KK1-11]TQS30506.1 peptidase S45 [Microbispora sp. KK1-11]
MKLRPLVIALALLAPSVAAVSPAEAADEGYSATIRRTEYGIPHITAKDYGGLGFGYGYAFAQDNLCTLASWVVTLRGERSRYFGPKAESDDPVRPVTNLAGDVYYKSVAESGVVRRLLARPAPVGPSAELRRLVDGYVAGYNRYLEDTGVANLPDPTCRGKAWVGPITATDMWNNLLDLDRMVSSSSLKEAITGIAEPEGPPEDKRPQPKPAAGSNAWALGRQATRGNGGMVLADPHFPWQGIRRFYQVQLTIPGVLDVSGGSLYGTPVVQIGHNSKVAWTHTVSHAQRFTVYRLKLAGGHSYLVDGRAEPMGEQEVEVTLPDGTVSGHTLLTSRYGPVLAAGQTDEAAYALADANAANLRAADEWLAMARAGSLDELRTAQRTYQGMPFVHTLATDASGTAYFADNSVVPHVTDAEAERCARPSPMPGLDAYVLDGSTSACLWGRDGDAVVPGIFGPGSQPRLVRADYVANSNNTYWMTNPAKPLTGYPKAYGETGTDLEPRPRVSLDMIAQRLSGTDGLGAPGFTLETLQATVHGKRNLTFELMRDDLLKLCRTHRSSSGSGADVREACRTLEKWDGRATLDGEGAVLWREFFTRLGRPTKPGEPFFSPWRVPFDPTRPLTTPSGLKIDDPAVRQALADAALYFRSNRIPLTLTPGQAQSYSSIPIPGCTEGEGCFDRVRTGGPLGTDGRYPEVNTGSSFMMAVELTPGGPRTRTVLTYSLSANPASPHHTDQTALFSRGGWVTERFTAAEIAADPHLETVTIHGGH